MNSKLPASLTNIHRAPSKSAINLDIMIALSPCILWSVFIYGKHALFVILTSVLTAVATDALICTIIKKGTLQFFDLSSAVCGIILALLMPASVNCMVVAVLALVMTVISALIPNFDRFPICPPALVLAAASLFLNGELTSFPSPYAGIMSGGANSVGVYSITSLIAETTPDSQWYELFFGSVCGPMGTVSVLLILAGGIYLLTRHILSLKATVAFMAGVAVGAYFITGSANPFEVVLYTCLTGQFLFGAIFCVSIVNWTVTDSRFNILIPAIGGALSVFVAFRFCLLAVPIAAVAVGLMSCLTCLLPPAQPPFGGS